MTDENGNDWAPDAVPGGIEIATVILEVEAEKGWSHVWSDCDGFRICPRVRIWLDGFTDLDYECGYLLKVWTDFGEGDDRVTTADHLAVYQQHAGTDKLTVEWRQEPRLFFDVTTKWYLDGLRWWANWLESTFEMLHQPKDLSPEFRADLAAHNASVRERDRERARALGLTLPYLETH